MEKNSKRKFGKSLSNWARTSHQIILSLLVRTTCLRLYIKDNSGTPGSRILESCGSYQRSCMLDRVISYYLKRRQNWIHTTKWINLWIYTIKWSLYRYIPSKDWILQLFTILLAPVTFIRYFCCCFCQHRKWSYVSALGLCIRKKRDAQAHPWRSARPFIARLASRGGAGDRQRARQGFKY